MLERPFSGESAGVKQGPGELDTSISLLTGSDELFNTFFMCSPIGLYIVQDGVFRLVNPKFEKEMGRGQHELVGREALSFVVPEHRDMVRRNAIEMLKGERTQPYEFIVATSNDERRWIMETVTSIQYHGRRATFGNFMDITDRKRAEEALRERQELHRAVVEQAAETICIVDVKTRLIIESNPAFRKLLGYDSVELQSMTLYDFIAHERSDIDQNIECIIGRGEHFLGERVWQRKDGSCVEMEVGANAISFAGRKALCVVARDLSDRKRAQKKRKFLMQRLLSVVEDERKRLGRDLHDELGSLLTALRFSLDALQVSISEADMQAPRQRCAEALGLLEQIGSTVRNILFELRPSVLDDLGLVPALEWYINRFMNRRISPNVMFNALGMKRRLLPETEIVLFRVFQECLNNVVKHAKAENVDVSLTCSYPKIIFVVKDDGVGFERIDGSPFLADEGHGIGLLGIRERVASMGGRFEVTSSRGIGTTVRIELIEYRGEADE